MENGDTGTVKRGRGRPKGTTKPGSKKRGVYVRGSGKTGRINKGYTKSEATDIRDDHAIMKIPTREMKTPEGKEYNARLIEHIMRINEIATHADKSDLLSLKSCFIAYLQLCQEDGFSVSNISAYASMGFYNTSHFDQFARAESNPERKEFCAFVKQTCSMFRENMIGDNKINPVIGIFWQRNYDGLRNDTEQVQAVQEQMDDEFSSSKSYKEKYKNLIGG